MANIRPSEPTRHPVRKLCPDAERLDRGVLGRVGHHDQLEASIANYELAFKMQTSVPGLMDLAARHRRRRSSTASTTRIRADPDLRRECLVARRLVERGVRFVELLCPNVGHDRWDQHGNLKDGHEKNARAVDRRSPGSWRI